MRRAQVAINTRVVVPMALQAGARSMRDDDHSSDSKVEFAKDGGGNSTKTLHRTVVAFVVAMLVGTVGHLHALSLASYDSTFVPQPDGQLGAKGVEL